MNGTASKRRVVGIDVDDCLADFVSAFTAAAVAVTGRWELNGREPADWEFSNFGLSRDDMRQVWNHIQNTPNFWLSLYKLPGTDQLEARENDLILYFVTSRVPSLGMPLEQQTAYWIRREFGIQFPSVILSKEKGKVAAALGCYAFIDDRPLYLEQVREEHPHCQLYLKSRSHNLNYRLLPRMRRVESVNEMLEEV